MCVVYACVQCVLCVAEDHKKCASCTYIRTSQPDEVHRTLICTLTMLILLLLLVLFRNMHGSLFSNGQTDIAVAGNGDLLPRGTIASGTRTISDIVISCLATIIACTWTAVHPNISAPTDSRWGICKRRTVTALCALFAPEAVATWALRQNIAAQAIVEEYNSQIMESELDDINEREKYELMLT